MSTYAPRAETCPYCPRHLTERLSLPELAEEIADMRAHVPFLTELLEQDRRLLSTQHDATTKHYGTCRTAWPCDSLHSVEMLERRHLERSRDLTAARHYLAELEQEHAQR